MVPNWCRLRRTPRGSTCNDPGCARGCRRVSMESSMNRIALVASFGLAALLTLPASAQGGGGGGRRQRPEEIQNRVGAFFSDISGPTADRDKVDLATTELVRAAVAKEQLSVLYL